MTIMPPDPINEPMLAERFVIDRKIEILFRDAAAGRAASLQPL